MELVASDDASTDETLAVLEAFSNRVSFPVRILRNVVRLGVEANFARAIMACSGDYIALADQDDVWRTDKLDRLSTALTEHGACAVFSDAMVVDADLSPLGYTMWQRVRFIQSEQARIARGEGFEVLLKHRIVTGATFAFKSDLRNFALPIPDGWQHDAWLALMAAAHGGLTAIAQPLVLYRQHGNNVVGGMRKSLISEIRAALALKRDSWCGQELTLWSALVERLGDQAPPSLLEKIAHLQLRANLPKSRWRRLPIVLNQLTQGHYKRFARNWGSVAIDLFVR